MNSQFLMLAVFLVLAVAFGFLTWVSKNVWQSRSRTRACALVSVLSTLCFVAVAMAVLP